MCKSSGMEGYINPMEFLRKSRGSKSVFVPHDQSVLLQCINFIADRYTHRLAYDIYLHLPKFALPWANIHGCHNDRWTRTAVGKQRIPYVITPHVADYHHQYRKMRDQYAQGNAIPRHGVRASYKQPSSQGIQLRPVSDLRMFYSCHQNHVLMSFSADAYRGVFAFGVFNAIQSTCFDDVSLFIASDIPRVLTSHQVDVHSAKFGGFGCYRCSRH